MLHPDAAPVFPPDNYAELRLQVLERKIWFRDKIFCHGSKPSQVGCFSMIESNTPAPRVPRETASMLRNDHMCSPPKKCRDVVPEAQSKFSTKAGRLANPLRCLVLPSILPRPACSIVADMLTGHTRYNQR
jgi:hypothetical protein